MKRMLALLGAAVIFAGGSGCAHLTQQSAPAPRRPLAIALAVTVNGFEQPTPSQWASIVAAVRPAIEAAGWRLATNLASADRILRIDFTPDPAAPETSGRAVALGWRTNPTATVARTAYTPAGFSHVNYGMGYSRGYYDYYNDYTQTWSRSSGDTPAPAVPTPPANTKPGQHARPDDCPPGQENRPPARYAGNGDQSTGSSTRGSWWRGRSDSGSSDTARASRSDTWSSPSSHSSYSSSSFSDLSSSSGGGSSFSSSSGSSGAGTFESSSAASSQIER